MKYYIIIALFVSQFLYSQSNIEAVLKQVSVNNTQLKAGNKLLSAKRSEFNIGLAPYDPFVSFDHLWGTPKEIGNQREFSLTFSFDFPTVYGKKSRLAEMKSNQLNYEAVSLRQSILLEAKETLVELTYLNRRHEELNERLVIANRIYALLVIKLEKGEINIMEVNKAKLQVIDYKSELEMNQAEINGLNTRLTGLNGGKQISFADTTYPLFTAISDFTSFEAEIEAQDPSLKQLSYEYKISKLEIDINKDMRLPKIEIGYRHQGLLSESFNGIKAGISIPLWEKNHIVSSKELRAVYIKSLIESHKNEHYFETKQFYDKAISLKTILDETSSLLESANNIPLYEKAFVLGEISVTEYLLETTYYYSIKDKINLLERDYYLALSRLFKYQL